MLYIILFPHAQAQLGKKYIAKSSQNELEKDVHVILPMLKNNQMRL
jgi:hypothetical protein